MLIQGPDLSFLICKLRVAAVSVGKWGLCGNLAKFVEWEAGTLGNIRESRPPPLPSSRWMKGKWDRHTRDSRGSPLGPSDKARVERQLQIVRRWTGEQGQLTWTWVEPCLVCTVWDAWWVSYLSNRHFAWED